MSEEENEVYEELPEEQHHIELQELPSFWNDTVVPPLVDADPEVECIDVGTLGWIQAVRLLSDENRFTSDNLERMNARLREHVGEKITPEAVLDVVGIQLNSDILPLLKQREDQFDRALGLLCRGALSVHREKPTVRMDYVVSVSMNANGIYACLECLRYYVSVCRSHFSTWTRGGQWDALRPIMKDKKKEEEKVDWVLVLHHHTSRIALRTGLMIDNGVLKVPVPGVKCAARALMKQVDEEDAFVSIKLEEWVWQNVISEKVDAEMYRHLITHAGVAKTACDFFIKKGTSELPHINSTHNKASFLCTDGEVRVLSYFNTREKRPELAIMRPGDLPANMICSTHHHDVDVDKAWLDMPLNPVWCIREEYEKRVSSGNEVDEKVKYYRWYDREGEDLLRWLQQETTVVDVEACRFDAEKIPEKLKIPTRFLVSFAPTSWRVCTPHAMSAQELYLLYAMLGRLLYRPGTDNWQVATFLQGQSRTGKSVFGKENILLFMGAENVGSIDTSNIDQFQLGNALNMRVLGIFEMRNDSKINIAALLQWISNEQFVLRKMKEEPITVNSVPFHVFLTGNASDPFSKQESAGEIHARILQFIFDHTCEGDADPTLRSNLKKEVGAMMIMCLRCYLAVKDALGPHRSVDRVIPFNMQIKRAAAKFKSNKIYEFLQSDWVVRNDGVNIESWQTCTHVQREASYKIRISDLGAAFRVFLEQNHPGSHMPWEIKRVREVFDYMKLPYDSTGVEVDGHCTNGVEEIDNKKGLNKFLRPRVSQGYVHGVQMSTGTEAKVSSRGSGNGFKK